MVWRLKRDGGEKKHNKRAVREKQLKLCFCGRGKVLTHTRCFTTANKINHNNENQSVHENQVTEK